MHIVGIASLLAFNKTNVNQKMLLKTNSNIKDWNQSFKTLGPKSKLSWIERCDLHFSHKIITNSLLNSLNII